MVQVIKGTLYTCECGYLTLSKDCASKHSKTKKCIHKVMSKEETGFVREEDIELHIKEDDDKITEKDDKIKDLEDTIKRLTSSLETFTKLKDTDEDTDEDNKDEGVGIIYFIVDKDLPDRGKIGRTKNTDVKKLKSRYSSFGNPHILCHWSTNIRNDENDLKTFMREAGCMKTNTEMISNVPLAREVFYEFIER
jgi:hypothetical protein